MEAIIWLGIFIFLLLIEIITLGLSTIWFAGGALVAAIAALCHVSVVIQIILFLVVSLLLLYFTRPWAMKYFNKNRIKTNAESLEGKTAIVTQKIENLVGTGQIKVNGMEWTARTESDTESIDTGVEVIIQSIHGVKAIVKKKD